jgi:hypothetical protein
MPANHKMLCRLLARPAIGTIPCISDVGITIMDDEYTRAVKRFRDQLEAQTARIDGISTRQDDFNGTSVLIRQDLVKQTADLRETNRKLDVLLAGLDKINRKLETIASA